MVNLLCVLSHSWIKNTCGQTRKNKVFRIKQKPQKPLGYWGFVGRDNRIWTCGLFVPNEARYQTALYPEIKYLVFSIFPCLWDNMWSKLIWPHVFCFLSRRKVAVLKGLWEFGWLLMNWIVPCPERSTLPNCAIPRDTRILYYLILRKSRKFCSI